MEQSDIHNIYSFVHIHSEMLTVTKMITVNIMVAMKSTSNDFIQISCECFATGLLGLCKIYK